MSTLLESLDTFQVAEVSTTAGLEALRPEWSALWERSRTASPFQSPEWLLPWWRHFGGEGLWMLTLRRAGQLVGLAPFFIYTRPESRARQVTLMGNGISDHLDLLLDPQASREGGAAVLVHLAARCDAWDTCDFRDLPAGSPLLCAPLPQSILEHVEEEDPCPTLALPDSTERLGEAVPARVLEKLRYYRRRAEKAGEVCFELAGGDNVGDLLGVLVELHGARWAARGELGVLGAPGVEDFHRDVVQGFLARGWLRLYALRVGGRIAAVYYGSLAKRRAYYYLGAFDPAVDKLSPGSVIVLHAVTEAVRVGAREFDFLRGREPYKYAWGAVDRPQYRRRIRPA